MYMHCCFLFFSFLSLWFFHYRAGRSTKAAHATHWKKWRGIKTLIQRVESVQSRGLLCSASLLPSLRPLLPSAPFSRPSPSLTSLSSPPSPSSPFPRASSLVPFSSLPVQGSSLILYFTHLWKRKTSINSFTDTSDSNNTTSIGISKQRRMLLYTNSIREINIPAYRKPWATLE